ncbi:MAG: GTPase [Armatimonadota bacterium]
MIRRDKTREFIDEIERLWDTLLPKSISGTIGASLKSRIMGEAIEELRRLVLEGRPPVIFLVGRTGHGKSSLINAICGREVAEVGDIKPTTKATEVYSVSFDEAESSWNLVDSRGLFESTSPGGGPPDDVVKMTITEILKHKPDVIMHVVAMPEIRGMANDLAALERIMARASAELQRQIPSFMVLTKSDTIGHPREWPPEEFPKKAGLIVEALQFTAEDVLRGDLRQAVALDPGRPLYGYRAIQHEHSKAIIPVCSLAGELWNIPTLQDFIGQQLPEDAQLLYYQALGRKDLLSKVASRLTRRFSEIAAGVGASPLPVADMLVLTPLQMLLVVMIGGLSCRPVAKSTFYEYLGAIGGTAIMGLGLRTAAQQLVKFIPLPIAAQAVSASIAGAGTYAIGRSAEAYFFGGKVKLPQDISAEEGGSSQTDES